MRMRGITSNSFNNANIIFLYLKLYQNKSIKNHKFIYIQQYAMNSFKPKIDFCADCKNSLPA